MRCLELLWQPRLVSKKGFRQTIGFQNIQSVAQNCKNQSSNFFSNKKIQKECAKSKHLRKNRFCVAPKNRQQSGLGFKIPANNCKKRKKSFGGLQGGGSKGGCKQAAEQ